MKLGFGAGPSLFRIAGCEVCQFRSPWCLICGTNASRITTSQLPGRGIACGRHAGGAAVQDFQCRGRGRRRCVALCWVGWGLKFAAAAAAACRAAEDVINLAVLIFCGFVKLACFYFIYFIFFVGRDFSSFFLFWVW